MKFLFFGVVSAALLIGAVRASRPHKRDIQGDRSALCSSVSLCMQTNSANAYEWGSIVSFLFVHSSWINNYINATCDGLATIPEQATCWGNALDALIDPTLGDLAVMKGCVCEHFSAVAGQVVCPANRRKRAIPGRRPSLNLRECPYVNPQTFSDQLVANVGVLSDPMDQTFADFESVIQFVSEQVVCQGLCVCTVSYHNAFMPTESLMCNDCWPTRLLALTSANSELLSSITNLVTTMEFIEPPTATNVTCVGDTVNINVGRLDLYLIGFEDGDDLIVWNTSVLTVDEVDSQCRVPFNNSIVFPLGHCNPNITHGGDVVTYHHTVWKVLYTGGSDIISFASFGTVNATCSFNRTFGVDYVGQILPSIRTLSFNETPVSGDFLFTMGFYDASYTTALPSNSEVLVSDWLNVRANLDGTPSQIKLKAIDCWATPTSNASDLNRYDIIQNGCPINETLNGVKVVDIIDNGNSENVDYRFRAFVWTHDKLSEVFVHCLVSACDSGSQTCTTNCAPGKKRRDLSMEKDVEISLTSAGPIKMLKPGDKNPCAENNGGCPEMCEVIRDQASCSCFPGRQRSKDGETCVDPDYSPVATYGQNVIVVLLIVNVAMIAWILVAHVRKQQ